MVYLNSITRGTAVALGCAAVGLTLASVAASAANSDPLDPVQLDPIIVIAPTVTVVGHDAATGAPIEDVTVTAEIPVDPAALRTEYGALMLRYTVRDAARKACNDADPLTRDDGTCFRSTMASAQPQIDTAIAQARSIPNE